MLNVVICDDEYSARESVEEYFGRFSLSSGENFHTEQYASGFELLENYPRYADIILLDIDMGAYDGLETAREIRKISQDVLIIFITNLPQYALQSFEVKPFGFLTKPLRYDVFSKELKLALERLKRTSPVFIDVKNKGERLARRLDISRIWWFEVKGHNIYAVSNGEPEIFRCTIKSLEEKTAGYGFSRCHESYIVNIRFIKSLGECLTMVNGAQIPVSRGRRRQFMNDFTRYAGAMP